MDFKALLVLMMQKKASDLFITAGRPPCMKVDGVLSDVSKTALTNFTFKWLFIFMNKSLMPIQITFASNYFQKIVNKVHF